MEKKNIVDPHFPYTYRRTLQAAKRLVCRFRGIVRTEEGGVSHQGRNICTVILGTGQKKILVLGAIHGREYVTVGFLLRCIEEYAQKAQRGESLDGFDLKAVLEEYSFYILPSCNPDSVEAALGRAHPSVRNGDFCAYTYKNNGRNVNLNANFPFEWEAVPACRRGGCAPASERETRFIINLCEKHCFEKALSFHTRGGCIYWRDGKNAEIKGDHLLAKAISDRCGLRLCPVTESPEAYSGGFENWFRHKYAKPALCIELVSDETSPFDLACKDFENYTDWERTKLILAQSAQVQS